MFKTILVAIDGSSTSSAAFRQALALAKEQGAALHVLHVIDATPIITGYEGVGYVQQDTFDRLVEALRKEGEKVLAKAAATAAKEGTSVQTVLVDAKGQGVADAILARARKLRADLIVLGTHGRRGVRRLVMGSDAETVVREATVPVMLLRSGSSRRARQGAAVPRRVASPREAASVAAGGA